MRIQENISLKPYNSFGVEARARYFSRFSNLDDLAALCSISGVDKRMVLGGGSNILFTSDFDGLVLKNEIGGLLELHEDEEYVFVRAGAGMQWHQFVLSCIDRDWAGVENLSLIPGMVGAAPIQNIGAYGVELEEVFWSLEAYHLKEKKVITLTKNDCAFGYRDSIFKHRYKGQFAIINVTFRLYKQPHLNTSYGAIEQELSAMGVTIPTIRSVSDAVTRIRSSKLPDPSHIGNAGSFFKNPEIPATTLSTLKKNFPGIVAFELPNGNYKLAAGWLIEQCGFKGFRKGDAGVHDRQALVLVNYGKASGKEIYDLSSEILDVVKKKFGVELEREVNIY